jgi:hypothetical protein
VWPEDTGAGPGLTWDTSPASSTAFLPGEERPEPCTSRCLVSKSLALVLMEGAVF